MPGIEFVATLENSQFIRSQHQIRESIQRTAKEIEASGMSIDKYMDNIAKKAASVATGLLSKELVSKIAQVRGEFQQLEVAFTTMLGSAEKADALMQQLTKTAAVTPFDLQGVASGAKQLLAYGISAEKVNDTLVHLGDIAAGLSLPLGDLVYLYGTTMTQGRMFTQDLRQFMSRGIPIADELAKQFGVTKDKVGELVTAGKVGAEEFSKAIMAMSSEGGKFAGLMEAQSKTINGQISNIEDAIGNMFNELGKKSEGAINAALGGVSFLIGNYESIGKVIVTVAASYGAYKAALLAVVAAQKLATVWGEVQAFLSLAKSITSAKDAMLLFNMVCKASPVGLVLGAITAAAVAFGLFSTSSSGATAAVEKYGKSAADTMQKVDTLATELKGLTKGSALHKEVTEELNQILDKYGVAQIQEGDNIDMLNEKREKTIELIKQEAIERQRLNNLEEGGNTYGEALKNARGELLEDLKEAGTYDAIGFETWGEDEIRTNADAISRIVANVAEENIGLIAEKTGKEYEDGLDKMLKLIQERMRRIGMSEDVIQQGWFTTGLEFTHDNIILKYLNSLKDAKEEYIRFSSAINAVAEADAVAIEKPVDKAREAADFSQTTTENLIKKIAELKGACDSIDREIDIRIKWGASVSFNSDDVLDFTDLQNAEEELKKRMRQANNDEAVDALLKELRTGKDKAEYGSSERKLYDQAIDELEKRKNANSGKKTVVKKNHTAEREAQRRQRLFELRQRQEEEQAAQEIETRNAIEEARIAAIRDDAERELAEQEYQHQKRLQAIDEQEAQMKKKLFEYNKAVWEANNTDSTKKYEIDTEEGRAGWKAIASLSDRNKNIEKAIEEANTKLSGLGIKLPSIDTSDIEKSRESIKNAVDGIKKEIGGIGSNDATITFTADTTQLSDIREQLPEDATVTYTIRKEEIGEIDVPEDALVHVTAVYDGSQLDKLSEIPKDATITIDTQLGSIDVPDIPETATIEVTAQIESGQYDELIEKFGEEVVKPVRIETEGEIVEGADETITVTVNTDASQLEELKASIPSDVPIRIYAQPEAESLPNIPKDAIVHVGYDVDPSNLKEAAEFLPEDYEIEISVDTKALEGLSLPADKEVTITTIVNDEQLSDLQKEMRDVEFSVSADTSSAIAALGEIQAKERTILEEAGKGGIISQLEGMFNGNVDVVARPLIDAAELVKAGWEDAGEGIASVFSSDFTIVDSMGNEHNILVTPILPDGSVLSPQEMDSYVSEALNGVDDILAADSLNIVVGIDQGDMSNVGETLHNLHEQLYDLPVDVIEKIRGLYETGDMSGIREALSIYNSLLATIDGIDGKYASAKHKLSGDSEKELAAQHAVEDANLARQLEERQRAERQQLYDYIKEYGSIQQQREAITKEYDEKIAREGDAIQKAILQKQKEQQIQALNFKELQGELNWEEVFGNLSRQSVSALRTMRDKLRQALDAKDITAENAQVIAEKIREVEDTITDKSDVLASILPGLRERKRLSQQAGEAENEYGDALRRSAEAAGRVMEQKQRIKDMLEGTGTTDALGQMIDIDMSAISMDMQDTILKMFNVEENSELSRQLSEAFRSLETATTDLQAAEEEKTASQRRKEAVGNFAKGGDLKTFAKDLFNTEGMGVTEIADIVEKNASSLADLVDRVGLENTDFGQAVHGFSEGVGGFTSAIQALQNGDVIGAVNGILDGVAGFAKLGTNIVSGRGNEEGMEKRIAELSKSNDRLSKAIDSLSARIGDSNATNEQSIDAYQQAYEAERMWQENQRKAIDARASEWASSGYGFLGISGKSSFNAHMAGGEWEGWKTFSDILGRHMGEAGVTHGSVNGGTLWSLTPEEMQLLRDFAPKEWEELFNTDGHRNPEDLVNEYMEHSGALDALTSALNEKLTGYSWDGFVNTYKSMLKDLTSTTEDFSENIEELISNALVESFANGEEMQRRIRGLYDKIAQYASKESAGGTALTEDEINDIRSTNEDIAQAMLEWREAAQQAGLIKAVEETGDAALMTIDTIKDRWMGMLMDMTADVEDWGSDIAKIMTQTLIKSNIFNDEWETVQQGWLDRYNEALHDQTLTDAQRKALLKGLQEEQEAWVEDSRRKAKSIMEMTGYDTATTAEQQNASVQAMERITVDQADELIGRMNAGQMIWEQGNDLSRQIAANLSAMSSLVSGGNRNLGDLVGLAATRNNLLSGIQSYCKTMYEGFSLQLDDIRRVLDGRL